MTTTEEKKIRFTLPRVLGYRPMDVYVDKIEETTSCKKKVFVTAKGFYRHGAIVENDRVIQSWRIIS